MTLPKGWGSTQLGDIAEFIMGQAPPGSNCNTTGDGMPFVKAGEFGTLRPIIREWTTRPLKAAAAGDILICVVGATAGKLNLGADCAIGRSVAAIRPSATVPAEFLYARLKSEVLRLRASSTGTAQGVISREMLASIPLSLPPLAEQRRIISKLTALTARLARARAELDRTKELAADLRSKALAHCFIAGDNIPTVTLDSVLIAIQSGKNMRCVERPPNPGERGVVKVSAVTWGRFDPKQSKTLPADYVPPELAQIHAGDLLMSRANTLELVGKPVLVEHEPRDLFLSDKILRLVTEEDKKKWVLWFLRSSEGRRQIEQSSSGNQISMRNIGQQAIRQIKMPLPDAGKRNRLLSALEAVFARANRLEAEAARTRALLDRLEAAILAKAFCGELVPQNPDDEPASVLLDRIRAQRAAAPAKLRKRSAKAA